MDGFSAVDLPLLLWRGAESDLLSPAIVQLMRAAQPQMTVVEIPHVGHAPAMADPLVQQSFAVFHGREVPVTEPART